MAFHTSYTEQHVCHARMYRQGRPMACRPEGFGYVWYVLWQQVTAGSAGRIECGIKQTADSIQPGAYFNRMTTEI
jgi:hypothetical protein